MAMLADRKVKQKWSLNPRGKAWSEDSNKFGQKMLEKMGWSKGKGLGAREHGIQEHVKISYKNDSKGMGYKETNNQWTEHDSNFNAFLQELSGSAENTNDTVTPKVSLEMKSQSSRVRVHYKKFTRGKDLSRCSEKDLANIFGKKSLKQTNEEIKIECEEQKNDTFTYSRGSMLDYFKKKLPNFGKVNGYVVGNNGVLKKESESEDEGYVGFGFKRKSEDEEFSGTPKKVKVDDLETNGFSNPAFDPLSKTVEVQKHILNTITEEEEMETEMSEEQKKNFEDSLVNSWENVSFLGNTERQNKNKNEEFSSVNSNLNETYTIESQVNTFEVKRKKRKNKQIEEIDMSETQQIKTNDCWSASNPSLNLSSVTEESQDNNVFEIKRKKSKKKSADKDDNSLAIENPTLNISAAEESQNNNMFEVRRKKKKKNASTQPVNDSFAIDNPNFDTYANGDSQNNATFEIKRKNKQKHNQSVNEESHDSNASEGKRKKKKNKDNTEPENDSLAIVNPNFDSCTGGDSQNNATFEVKRKKKQKKTVDNESVNEESQDSNTFEVKRKKKQKKDVTNESPAVVNPNFNESVTGESHNNNALEVKREKKKKNDSLELDNPNFNQDTSDDKPTNVKQKKDADLTPIPTVNDTSVSDEAIIEFDLMLNVTSTPQANSTLISSVRKSSAVKRRKSVRFNDVTQQRIIPNNDEEKRNELFDINSKVLSLEHKLDGCQAEIENDLNEAKVLNFVGEVGNIEGENEKLSDGTKLKFKYATFGRSPSWGNKHFGSNSKSAYKHLIKGDIVLGFKNTNLHEIVGYAQNVKNKE